jgi:hypothetical protein
MSFTLETKIPFTSYLRKYNNFKELNGRHRKHRLFLYSFCPLENNTQKEDHIISLSSTVKNKGYKNVPSQKL